MRKSGGRSPSMPTVRIGPVTILTLIIILCLATLGVLALATAHASAIAAGKQASATQSFYADERQGQEFVARVDGALSETASAGGGLSDAIDRIRGFAGKDAVFSGNTVTEEFVEGDRQLKVTMEIENDLTYKILAWTTSSTADTSENLQLWPGSGSNAQDLG